MHLAQVIAERHMTRHFIDEPIAPVVLEHIVRAALRAPSAGFSQGIDLLVLTEATDRGRFWELTSDPSWRLGASGQALMAAGAIVVPIADPEAYVSRYREDDKATSALFERDAAQWPVPYWSVDAAFVTMLILLGATDQGLGALFFQLHGEVAAFFAGFGVPSNRVVIGAIALGHRAPIDARTSPAPRARRAPDDVLHFGSW